VLAVQAPGVLLQRALPGHRHREHQRVERRVIETFADQLAGGQQDARRIGRKRVLTWHQCRPLLPGHSAVQDERCGHKAVEFQLDGVEVFGAFGQNQHLAALFDSITDLGGDGRSSGLIRGEMPEDVLDAGVGR
jgi:hypothetical protein